MARVSPTSVSAAVGNGWPHRPTSIVRASCRKLVDGSLQRDKIQIPIQTQTTRMSTQPRTRGSSGHGQVLPLVQAMWRKRQMLTLMQLVVPTKKGCQAQSDLRVCSLCNPSTFFLLIRLGTAYQHGDSCRAIGLHWRSVCNGGRSVKSPPDCRCPRYRR
jgi:hypothetical protein